MIKSDPVFMKEIYDVPPRLPITFPAISRELAYDALFSSKHSANPLDRQIS